MRILGWRGPASRGSVATIVTILALAGIVGWGLVARGRDRAALARETRAAAIPTVAVTRPERGAGSEEVVLPATTTPIAEAPIYARVGGYLRRRYVDIGSRVRAGQLLAEIDAPELQQQLEQAQADLASAEANLQLARTTAARYVDLRRTDAVSQQDVDNATGNLDARRAAVAAASHNVQRLRELKAFTRVTAPIAGIVSARNTDVGALVDPGSGGGPARELFHVASIGRLRIVVDVPERYAPAIKPGTVAGMTLPTLPGRRFPCTVARTAGAIDPGSHTLRVELDVANPRGEILPGSYAEVHVKVPGAAGAYRVPVSAVIFGSVGPRVAIVGARQRIEFRPVTPGRDFGTEMEVVAGLAASDRVVVNPSSSLVEGQVVRVAAPRVGGGDR